MNKPISLISIVLRSMAGCDDDHCCSVRFCTIDIDSDGGDCWCNTNSLEGELCPDYHMSWGRVLTCSPEGCFNPFMRTDCRQPIHPRMPSERVVFFDSLRGLALLAVAMTNSTWLSGNIYREWAQVPKATSWLDTPVGMFHGLFIHARGFGLLAILFGIGLTLQHDRFKGTGDRFVTPLLRRFIGLMILVLFHSVLFWAGDILVAYAVTGLLTLPFLNARPKTLWAWIWCLYLLYIGYANFAEMVLPGSLVIEGWSRGGLWLVEKADGNFGTGTFWQAARWRLWEATHLHLSIHLKNLPLYLSMFLIGVALWKMGFIQNAAKRSRSRRLFHTTFWPGMALQVYVTLGNPISAETCTSESAGK
ncbi:MAG: hypothetical protein QNJ97_07490 [Myxococcota bacterium]|nr:hypothetical protein [Myxococcota bacterium]